MSTFGDGLYQYGGVPVGVMPTMDMFAGSKGEIYFVDGTNGSDGNNGKSPSQATKTIQHAVDLASGTGAVVYVFPKTPGIWDPVGYEETVIVPYTKTMMSIIGVRTSSTYGAMPHMAIGAGSTAMITLRAPGSRVSGLSFLGTSSTGGGILLDDDGSTKSAYGATIDHCYFYDCLGSAAAATGGGIMWSANGGAWQVNIEDNEFMQCRAGIVLKGTAQARPTGVNILRNKFASWVNTDTDIDIDLGNGSGAQGVIIDGNTFATVGVPAYAGAGATARYMDLTGCEGIVSNNTFACDINATATEVTFGAAGTAAFVPTTIAMANNWGNSTTVGETAEVIHIA